MMLQGNLVRPMKFLISRIGWLPGIISSTRNIFGLILAGVSDLSFRTTLLISFSAAEAPQQTYSRLPAIRNLSCGKHHSLSIKILRASGCGRMETKPGNCPAPAGAAIIPPYG